MFEIHKFKIYQQFNKFFIKTTANVLVLGSHGDGNFGRDGTCDVQAKDAPPSMMGGGRRCRRAAGFAAARRAEQRRQRVEGEEEEGEGAQGHAGAIQHAPSCSTCRVVQHAHVRLEGGDSRGRGEKPRRAFIQSSVKSPFCAAGGVWLRSEARCPPWSPRRTDCLALSHCHSERRRWGSPRRRPAAWAARSSRQPAGPPPWRPGPSETLRGGRGGRERRGGRPIRGSRKKSINK